MRSAQVSGRGKRTGGAKPPRDVANSYSATTVRRRGQWAALRALWKLSKLARVRACRHHAATGREIGIARRGDRAHYCGLQTCGSVWACPVCSARIQAERTAELRAAIEEAHRRGLRIAMATLTMRHRKGRRLKPMWDALSAAWQAAMTTDRAVQRAKKKIGVVGWVRRVEATHGANGWHVHAHAIIFYRGGSLSELDQAMWDGWLRRLRAHGLDAERGPGLQLKRMRIETARGELASYVNKAVYDASRAAREMGGQQGKNGRRGNRAPFDILADLVADGELTDLAKWSEWETASRGRRALTWSKGLRDDLVGDVERTDEEIAADSDDDQQLVGGIDKPTWKMLQRWQLEVALLEAVEAVPASEAYTAAAVFLDGYNLPPPSPPL